MPASLRVHSCTLLMLATAPRSTCIQGVVSAPPFEWYTFGKAQLVDQLICALYWKRTAWAGLAVPRTEDATAGLLYAIEACDT